MWDNEMYFVLAKTKIERFNKIHTLYTAKTELAYSF